MLTEAKPVVNFNADKSVNGVITWRPDPVDVRAYANLFWRSSIYSGWKQ